MLNKTKTTLKTIIKINLFVFLFFSTPSFVQGSNQGDLTVTVKPDFPKEHQLVTVSVASYLVNLGDANVSWYRNGKIEKKGMGKISFRFKTGDLGSSDDIRVIIQKDLTYFTKIIKITPANVDLVWEAETYTPPFYKGKALNSYQSRLRIVAIPDFVRGDGSKVPASDIIYQWKKGWRILGSKSGYGKNVLILDNNKLPGDKTIILKARTRDNKFITNAMIIIKKTQPQVLLYNKDPLFGVKYEKSLNNQFNLAENEVTIIAEPFFFSKEDIKNNLKYDWLLNNKNIKDSENKQSIILRQDSKNSGSSNLDLKVQNIDKIMQFSEVDLLVNFGKDFSKKLFNSINTSF